MTDILLISLSVSAVIVIMLTLTPLFKRRYSAKWRYIVWLLLAIRLIIPVRFERPVIPIPTVKDVGTARIDGRENADETAETARGADSSVTSAERQPTEAENGSQTAFSGERTGMLNAARRLNLQAISIAIWAIGAASFFLWHVISYLMFRRKIKPYCKRISHMVYRCDKLESPVMTGFFRPQILIPNMDYSKNELEIIIEHEMTHYKRRDMWYKLLLLIANAIHWFNPLVYIMVRCADRDMEYSCDDAVVKGKSAEFRKAYSRVILKTIGANSRDL